MIISKRNYLEKAEMAKPLKSFIDQVVNCENDELPAILALNSSWERPRGDLFNWVPVLNKFDSILAQYITKYGLDQEYPVLKVMSSSDSEIIISCLKFTTLLFEHCSNRSLYNSSERLGCLILSADIDIALATLETWVALGERFVQNYSAKYAAPKSIKLKVLEMAKAFPPPVPALFKPSVDTSKVEKDHNDHYSLLDTLTFKKYPNKWKSIHFEYFREPIVEQQQLSKKTNKKNKNKSKNTESNHKIKEEKSEGNENDIETETESKALVQPAEAGLTTFSITENKLRNMSIQDVFDAGMESIPNHLWFDFALHAVIAKSFNNKSPKSIQFREKLLQLKCFATGFVTCMCRPEFTSSRLFESQPFIFSFLVDLINPENRKLVSRESYYSSVKAMECISLQRSSFGNDLIRCLGGNVSHGILFQCIRAINKSVIAEEPNLWEREFIHLFNMLGNLIDVKILVPRFVSGGLLTDLMAFFNIHSKYRCLSSAAIHLTNLLIGTSPESLDGFILNSGFQLLIDTIKYETELCIENPEFGGGPPKDAIVYYNISFRQANYIRNLLKLVLQLIQSEAGDRLRNLFDSPLLGCFNTILLNPTLFGPLIISSILETVFYIIHNEPTAYAILNEAKVVDTILDNYRNFFVPHEQLLMILADIIEAICLNKDGLEKVISKKIIETFFDSFFNLELAKEMIKVDLSVDTGCSSIGCSIDELGRHYPTLKPIIMAQIKRLVTELPQIANSKLPKIGIYRSESTSVGANFFTDSSEPIPTNASNKEEAEINSWDSCDLAYLMDNAYSFIGGVLQDSRWGELAMKEIKYEQWISFMSLSNAPFDYTTSSGLLTYISVLKFFDEEKRDYGLPTLLKTLMKKMKSEEVQDFINNEDFTRSFFEEGDPDVIDETLKQLNVINILMFTLTEIYVNPGLMFHERFHQVGDILGKEGGIELIKNYGLLLRRCMVEEILIRTRLPEKIIKLTAPLVEGVKNTTEYPPLQIFAEEPSTTPVDEDKEYQTSNKFKNTIQLRFFMYRFQNYVSTIFTSIGRICMHKRQEFVNAGWRRLAVKITLAVGETISTLLDTKLPQVKHQELYLLVLINIGLYTLSQRERGNDVIQTSLAISLFQNKFFHKLSAICEKYFHVLLTMDKDKAASTKELRYINQTESSMIKNILSQSLMIFAKIVDLKAFLSLPSVKQYFHEGYEDALDTKLIGAFLVQTKLIGIDLMDKLIGDLTSNASANEVTNIPSPVVEQLIYILKHVLIRDNKENYETEFVGYDVENVSPPLKLVEQLKKVLVSSQAEHFFKHGKDLIDLSNGKFPDCPHLVVRDEEWAALAKELADVDVSDLKYTPNPEICYSVPSRSFKIPNRLSDVSLIKNMIRMTTFFPKCIISLVDIVAKVETDDKDKVLSIVMKEIENMDHNSSTLELNSVMKFLSEYIIDCTEPSDYFERILQFMIRKLEAIDVKDSFTAGFVNEDWFGYGLSVIGIFILYKQLPVPEKTTVAQEIQHETTSFVMSDESSKQFLDLLVTKINYSSLTNINTPLEITKIFTLYSTEYAQTRQLIPVVIQLLLLNRTLMEKNERPIIQQYQLSLICLIRRCFETTDVLKNYMFAELNNILKSRNGGSSELMLVLKNTKDLAFRNQEMYVDLLCRDLRLENYDGTPLLNKMRVYQKKQPKGASIPDNKDEDVEMTDANEIANDDELKSVEHVFESTGILKTLLNELMDVCKSDWISDPVDESQVNKEKDFGDNKKLTKEQREANVFKNKNFAYVCLLLQTIAELLASYKQSKFEFITFSRKKSDSDRNDLKKPRATALNFIIHQLIPTQQLSNKNPSQNSENERRVAVSSLAKLCVLALTSTPILDEENEPIATKEDHDMAFIRKFYVDIIQKILKDTANTTTSSGQILTPTTRYSKLIDLCDLCSFLISNKYKELMGPVLNKSSTKYDTYYMGKVMSDKQLPILLSSIVAEFDLNFPKINRVSKLCIKPITLLGKVKTEFQSFFHEENQNADAENDAEDIEIEDNDDEERDETPDLFRNSTLGMYDVESESGEEEESGEEFYDNDELEELLDGENASDDDDEDDEDDDDNEDDDDDDDEDDDDLDGDDDNLDEDIDMDGIIEGRHSYGDGVEIIDLDNASNSGEDSDSDVDEDEEESFDDEDSGIYDFDEDDDESVSEYDDEELDGWIQAFESDAEDGEAHSVLNGDEEEGSSLVNTARSTNAGNHNHNHGARTSHRDINGYAVDSDSDGENDLESLNESIEGEADALNLGDRGSRAADFANTFFESILPGTFGGSNERPITSLFGHPIGDGSGNNLLRGAINIGGSGAGRMSSNAQSFERTIERILQLGSNTQRTSLQNDPALQNMYIKSTKERWSEACKRYESRNTVQFHDFCSLLVPKILNLIADDSLSIFKAKREKEIAIKKEQAEKLKRKQETERIRREEEAKARDLQAENDPTLIQEPIMVRIGDREVDISGTDIDPEFFEALPDDMREEVFTQHVRERRANVRSTGVETREIDPDFLDALPDSLREEILQQEVMARRFSSLDELEDDVEDEDEDDDQEVDGEEGDEAGNDIDVDDDHDDNESGAVSDRKKTTKSKVQSKKFFTSLVDRAGVASLIRLLFIPQPMNQRDSIHTVLEYLCHNKQTRAEVMNLLICILQDGLTNQKSIEKTFAQITVRAKGKLQGQQHPSQTKPDVNSYGYFPVGATPLIIGNQIIEAILHLLDRNVLMRYYILTEHENIYKKKDSTITKEGKYPINYLLNLLDNDVIKSEQPFLDVLALVFQIATRPLHILKKSKGTSSTSPFPPPYIPEKNFRNLIQILTSHDCSKTTFRTTISAMQNISVLPNAQKVFSEELSEQATNLGKTLINELSFLSKEISNSDSADIESTSLSKFNASSSDQSKLLRILTALDYMFETKSQNKKENIDDEVKVTVGDEEIEELTSLYKKLALGSLWDALSNILRILGEKQDILSNISTALLPLIESLMIVCKHSKVKDYSNKENVVKFEVSQKRIDFTKEPIENLFFSFTDEHKKILNQMVRSNPNLMSGPFGLLVRNPRVLEFDNKRNYFDRMLHKLNDEHPKLPVNIRRDQVFLDSYRSLFFKPLDEFRKSKLEITFKGEAGVDAGGVTREWYQVLSRQMFNPDYALFTPVASDETTFHPNRTSYVNPEHLSFFKFIGRIIGKAIYDNNFLDCHFSRAVYKRLLSRPVSLKDMETLDLEYFKSLMWMLENDITDVITEDFSVETDDYGEHKTIELIPDGANIPVTEENKYDYVKKIVEYKLQTSITEQMDNFLIGFHEVIPKELVAIFDEQELELLISGLPDIDVDDWKANTTYQNYSPSSPQIQWFWRAVKSFDTEERAKLLQFATGTSKVPLNGFKELSGANSICKFSIHRDYSSNDRLPLSHTCFNQVDLPEYQLYEELRGNLLLAVTEGHEGFGLA